MKKELQLKYQRILKAQLEKGFITKRKWKKEMEWLKELEGKKKEVI